MANHKDITSFETKKSIHFTVTRETHSKVRIECFKRRLSMQEIFEEFAQRIAAESPETISFLEKIETDKKDRIIKQLSKTDAESIFNVIEVENPLSEK